MGTWHEAHRCLQPLVMCTRELPSARLRFQVHSARTSLLHASPC